MNALVTEAVDVATPIRHVTKDLEQQKRSVDLNYPILDSIIGKTYTVEEAFDIVGKRLSRNYGVEIIID